MAPISLDLRERIVEACDNKEGTQAEIAKRFKVSLGMVKKLLKLRKKYGEIGPRYHSQGGRRKISQEQEAALAKLVASEPDLTLEELREALNLDCTVQAVHYALRRLGLTYKKRHSEQANAREKTSLRGAKNG